MINRLYLATTPECAVHPDHRRNPERFATLLAVCATRRVELVDSPIGADAIVFVGSVDHTLADIRSTTTFRRNRDRCLVVHGGGDPWPALPGVYASIPRRWCDPRQHRAGFYLRVTVDTTIESAVEVEPRHLYSFVGARGNGPIRDALFSLSAPNGLVVDSSRRRLPDAEARKRFNDSLRDSLFVLCPGGLAASSFRIFEAMKAGRVPVVIADQWVEPIGPDWAACSLRVRERDIPGIPSLLSERAEAAYAMGRAARAAWEAWFSPRAAAGTILGWLDDILDALPTKVAPVPFPMRPPIAMADLRYRVKRLQRAAA